MSELLTNLQTLEKDYLSDSEYYKRLARNLKRRRSELARDAQLRSQESAKWAQCLHDAIDIIVQEVGE